MALKILGQILTGASVVAVGVIVMGLPLLIYLWKEAGRPKRKGRDDAEGRRRDDERDAA